jgi:serine protease AprX
MNKQNRKRMSVLLLYCLLLAFFLPFGSGGIRAAQANRSALSSSQAQAGESSIRLKGRKLSPELESKLLDSTLSEDPIRTIVQVNDPESDNLRQLLKRNGVRLHKKLRNLQMLDVELPAKAIREMADSDDVQFISADQPVAALGHLTLTTGADAVRTQTGFLGLRYTLDGSGVTIAILDSGLDDNHKAFQTNKSRLLAIQDFTGEGRGDAYGHGTHVAGLAAADDDPTNNAYGGIAPNANLVILKVLNKSGVGTVSGLLSAINWLIANQYRYNIRVVNMSLGMPAVASYLNDPLCLAVRRLVDAGIVVVAAAGNDGKDDSGQIIYGRIHSPGIEPSAITVGCSNSFGTDSRADDDVATYSSRGPTRSYSTNPDGTIHYDNLVKPDLVAPGNQVIQAEADGNYLVRTYPQLETNIYHQGNMREMYLSGTSMASPQVAGAAALILQANPLLTPNIVKTILMYTAQPLAGFNLFEQGAGELNIEGAIRLAKLIRPDMKFQTVLGVPLLVGPAPVPQTTIAGGTFTWAQGITGDYSFITGTDLITKYQIIFAQGHLLSNADLQSDGHLLSNSTQVTNGVMVADTILTSDGNPLGNGSALLDASLLFGSGTLLPEGHLLSNGIIMGDGHLLSNSTQSFSVSVLVNGDKTSRMK